MLRLACPSGVGSGPSGQRVLATVMRLVASALLLWSLGLELLGWLVLVVYVGALAILFLFVVTLLDRASGLLLRKLDIAQ